MLDNYEVFYVSFYDLGGFYMITLKCDNPIRIRNKYNGQWMYVNCRACQSCKINQVNLKTVQLTTELNKYPFACMVTLTYDNEHLPYMAIDSNKVYRGIPGRAFPSVVGFVDIDIGDFQTILPSRFPDGCFTGVLFYKDLQNFFKRLRFNYGRTTKQKFPYRFHAICEYGSSSKRPHFHVLFYGRKEFDEHFRDTIVKSWKLHDWSKLPMEETIKFASAGISSYLCSYVNSLFGDYGFLSKKGIKSKTFRSKALSFGTDKELCKNFEKAILQGICNLDFERNSKTFGDWDCSKLGDFSFSIIPSKYVSAYTGKVTNVHRSAFHNEYECNRYFLTKYFEDRRKGREIDNDVYKLYLSYDKYCSLRKQGFCDASLIDFSLDSVLIRNYYKSLQLKQNMLQFDGDIKAYKDNCYNTYVDDLDKRNFWLLCNNIVKKDDVNSPSSFNELQNYKQNYRYKLLPKHLHGLIFNGNNL